MTRLLGKWLKVYPDEIGLFFWSAALFFLIHTSDIIFNNFAETAFLKRFGVQYMPIMTAVNSVATFFIMGFLTGFMVRISGARLLTAMLLICGLSVAGLWLFVPLGFNLLYALLYVLKTQYEALLGLLFWNLANDLFDTRQSKRLFPLITAGGIIGGIVGSFGTPYLAHAISVNNLMLAYLATSLAGAAAAKRMETLYPPAILPRDAKKKGAKRGSIIEEMKQVFPLVKSSKLAKILILLTFLPNVVIPMMNYQFSFAVDQTYGTEGEMIRFFGYFRGLQNVLALIISLFVGRIYSRFGLPVALLFHPFNYMLAFFGFLVRFDVFSAMYARLSTAVLRNTVNTPARAVLFGLFPSSYRAVIRPFLRGTVVRVATLAGSGIVLLSQPLMHPRNLSLVGIIVVAAWIVSTLALKRNYTRILLDLISREMLDLKSLEEHDLRTILREPGVQPGLVRAFRSSKGEDAVWYGDLLRSTGFQGLDGEILSKMEGEDERTAAHLLPLLSPGGVQEAIRRFVESADPERPDGIAMFAGRAREIFAKTGVQFGHIVFRKEPDHRAKAFAAAALYPDEFDGMIRACLESDRLAERKAAVIAAGGSHDRKYIERLREILRKDEKGSLTPELLPALKRLGDPDVNRQARPFLAHEAEDVRLAALEAFEIRDDGSARTVIARLGDASDPVRDLAVRKLEATAHPIGGMLVEALMAPGRRTREGIFRVSEAMKIKEVEVLRFARAQLEAAYRAAAESLALRRMPENQPTRLLIDHLEQIKGIRTENVLRVLAAQDRSGQLRTIWRGLSSADPLQRANSIEALDGATARSLSRILIPILENLSPEECVAHGRKHFKLPGSDSDPAAALSRLLRDEDWLTVLLALQVVASRGPTEADRAVMADLAKSGVPSIRDGAGWYLDAGGPHREDGPPPGVIAALNRIPGLRGAPLFSGLSIAEAAVVASVAREEAFRPGEILIGGDRPWEEMVVIEEGEVSVARQCPGPGPAEDMGRGGTGETIGLLSLFVEAPENVVIRATKETRCLILQKKALQAIMTEYPTIALGACRILSRRLRTMDERMRGGDRGGRG